METEFKKNMIEMGKKIPCADSAVIAEGDVIVPDIKPDVKSVMSVDANAAIKKTEILGNVLKISGTIFVNILYIPETSEEKEKVCAINTKFDFADEIKIQAGTNVKATAEACVRHIDFSLINSRKLNLKIYVGLSFNVFEKDVICFLDKSDSEDVLEVRKNKVGIYSVIDDTTREIVVSENVDVPKAKAEISEILKVEAVACGNECKLMTNKILVKGILCLNMLYITADSEEDLESLEVEIPFSDVFDVDGITEDSLVSVKFNIKDYYYNVKNDINGNPRIVSFESLIDVYISAAEIIDTEVTEDCFIPGKKSNVEKKQISTYEIKGEENGKVNVKQKFAKDGGEIEEIYSCTVKPVILEQTVSDGENLIKGCSVCSIVAKTSDETIVFDVKETPFEYVTGANEITEDSFCESKVCLISKNCNIYGGELEVNANIGIYTKTLNPISFETVTECNIDETETEEKSAMLVIYFVQNGDELWDIAKKYKTTPRKIRLANNLGEKEKVCAGMKLLIPTV